MWRDTGRIARLGPFDGRASVAIMLWMVHMRVWTLIAAGALMVAFFMIERFGFTVAVLGRLLKTWLAGNTIYTQDPYLEMIRFVTSKQEGGLE